jgi:hypothetical protein
MTPILLPVSYRAALQALFYTPWNLLDVLVEIADKMGILKLLNL